MSPQDFSSRFFAELRALSERLNHWSKIPWSSQEAIGDSFCLLLTERDRMLEMARARSDHYTVKNIEEADRILLPMVERITKLLGIRVDYLPATPGALSLSAQQAFSQHSR